ncbi:MAG: alpha-amylase family glycosyl hydrolase [Fimbriimonadaceae bacterium]|jgi:1,4-alpha-glucan branching enzyme|nr:alpha-amylase family glycosyl hydrolase [Fimbriimonadaceae bacterium]
MNTYSKKNRSLIRIRTAATILVTLLTTLSLLAQTHLGSGDQTWKITRDVPSATWEYFTVDVADHQNLFDLNVQTSNAATNLYLRKGKNPTLGEFTLRVTRPTNRQSTILTNTSRVRLSSGRWHIGVHVIQPGSYTLTLNLRRRASEFPGMGATVRDGLTSFRIWAPNALGVNVAGQFNGWSATNVSFANEGNGIWSVDLRGARHGQEYKYVIRTLTQTLWRNDPWARSLTNSVGNSVLYRDNFNWTFTNYVTPNWNEMVIYQMHVGTFNDVPGSAVGNLDTAIQRLDYLQTLGVNAIKLMPVHEFAGDYSWGYNPSYPFSVESAYGGPDALKRFVDACRQRGIAVILDVVHNHYGPSDLDMWRFDGWAQGNYGGIFFYNDGRAATPWGDTRPDYGRSQVRDYIRDNQNQWLNEFRIDGLRWDATAYIRETDWGNNPDGWSLMQWLNNTKNSTTPWKISIAEDMRGESWITRPTSSGGAGFDSQWAPNVVHPLRSLMVNPSDSGRDMFALRDAIRANYNGNALSRIIYTESHDEVANGRSRVPQEIDPSNPTSYWARKRSTLGGIMVLTTPGIPMIFMGQEFLENGFFQDTRPLDWAKSNTFAGIRQMYTDLISLRRNRAGISRGLTGPNVNVHHINNTDKVIAYHRWSNGGAGDDVIVLMNWSNRSFTNYQVGLPRGGRWNVVFNSDWVGYSSDFQNTFSPDIDASTAGRDGLSHSGGFNLGPYSALIISQRP